MNHLTLVKPSTEKLPADERLEKENETEEHFLTAFDDILEGVKKQKIPFQSHEVGPIGKDHKGVESILESMPENSACYIELSAPDHDGNSRHLLVVKRSKDNESIMTFVSVKTSDTELKCIRMYQEVKDEATGFNNQVDITFDPATTNITDFIYQARIGDIRESENTHTQKSYSRKSRYERTEKALQLVDSLVNKATSCPIEEAVSISITEETDRIKANVRGKGRMRAFGSAVIHFPDFYRQQREAA